MPSRAETRAALEWTLRATMIAALGIALWRSLRPDDARSTAMVLPASVLTRELGSLMATPGVSSVALTLDAMPNGMERDALLAMRRAGVAVSWHGSAPAIALEAQQLRDPGGRVRLLAKGASLTLVDSAGLLDSVKADAGASVDVQGIVGRLRAEQGRFAASVPAPESAPQRAVLVLSRADWDSKFVMSALSEAGWTVRSRILTAPGVNVSDAGLLPLDTARYDVVVALDTSASDLAPAIVKFVAQGGGLIVGGDGLTSDALRALAPASAEERRPGRILLAEDSVTPRDLPLRALNALRSDALPLERVPAGISVAARRTGLGRTLAVGYDDSWRWRMLGGVSGLAAHRRWWSSAVGSVAPERSSRAMSGSDGAPLAALVGALGEASASTARSAKAPADPLPLIILIVLVSALLAETGSRRFRGVS